MNLYTIEFIHGDSKHTVSIKAKNKIEAVTMAWGKLGSWREKDRVEEIRIVEDTGNADLSAADYK